MISVGTAPSVDIVLNNTGKTPATDIVGHFYVEVIPNGQNPRFEATVMHTSDISGVIAPNSPQDSKAVRKKISTSVDEDEPLLISEKNRPG